MTDTATAHTVLIPRLRIESVPNLREHWSKKADRTKTQRALGFTYCRRVARAVTLPCVVRLVRIAPRAIKDGDNLVAGFKAVRDGIADALRIDDGDESKVQWEYAPQERGKPREYAVRVEIESVQ